MPQPRSRGYLDVKVKVRPPSGKEYWHKIGFATEVDGEHGRMYLVTLDSMPINWDGKFAMFPTVKKEKTRGVLDGRSTEREEGEAAEDLGDIPF
jgi:hypothetical protein